MSTQDDRRLTHPLNVGYLVVGLVCLGIAGLWALHAANVVDAHQLGWMVPLTLVVAGAVGLVALAARGLTRQSGGAEARYDDGHDGAGDPYASLDDPYDVGGRVGYATPYGDTDVLPPTDDDTTSDPDEGASR